jgi:uncharacterized protein (DUF433 family)
MNYSKYISRDPKICGGQPVVAGTRILVRTLLASLADGASTDELLKEFPTLKPEAIRAVIAFAASSAQEDMPRMPVPSI